jgi:hypothetical protein
MDFGSFILTNSGAADAFIAKYDVTGQFLWAECLTGPRSEWISGLTTDKSGDVYLSARVYEESIVQVSDSFIQIGKSGLLIIKYSSNQDKTWLKVIGPSLYVHAANITTDQHGNVCLFGDFMG